MVAVTRGNPMLVNAIEALCMADAEGYASRKGTVICPGCRASVEYSFTRDYMLIANCSGCGVGFMAEWLGESEGAPGPTGPATEADSE